MRLFWITALALACCVPSRENARHNSAAAIMCPPQATLSSGSIEANAPLTSLIATPNPLLSRTKKVVGYSAARFSDPKRAVDGDYRSSWEAGRPTASAPAWIAIEAGPGPKRLLLSWSAGGSYNYEETDYGSPGAYRIEVSADSTNGKNGTWKTVVDVPEVKTHGRAHEIDFDGDRWIKLVVTGVPAVSPNGVQISEIDVHDASAGMADTWFFLGDSITALAFDRSPSHPPSFADCVHGRHASYFPMMINGGTGGARSVDGAAHIDDWMALNPDARYWAIGYGSNDSAGDTSDTTEFRAAMQTMVRRLKSEGHVPILATIPYSKDGQHLNIPSFNRVIADIQLDEGLPKGPDLYAWFLQHPDELRDDGLHPNDRGAASMNRLWADAVDSLYPR